jgi:small subunit ribosomal protein S6
LSLRTYETIYIVHPEVGEEEVAKIESQVDGSITGSGGNIALKENWGKRKLAYEVKHCTEGYYLMVRHESEPDFVHSLESSFRINEQIIRYLIVLFDEQELKLEEIQKQRSEEQAKALAERERGRGDRRSDDDDDDDDDRPRRPRRDDDDDD